MRRSGGPRPSILVRNRWPLRLGVPCFAFMLAMMVAEAIVPDPEPLGPVILDATSGREPPLVGGVDRRAVHPSQE